MSCRKSKPFFEKTEIMRGNFHGCMYTTDVFLNAETIFITAE